MSPDGKISAFGGTFDGVPRPIVGVAVLVVVLTGAYLSWLAVSDRHPGPPAAALRILDEYQKHAGEDPEWRGTLRETPAGRLSQSLYRDGCLMPTWIPTVGQPRSTLILPLWADPDGPPPSARSAWPFEAIVAAQSRCDRVSHGAVAQRWDEQRGPWLYRHVVYRDGCHSAQPYDLEHRVLYPVQWIVCRH